MFISKNKFTELKRDIEVLKNILKPNTLSSNEAFLGVYGVYHGSKTIVKLEKRIDELQTTISMLLRHLNLKIQDKCTEGLPKIIKVKKGQKTKNNKLILERYSYKPKNKK